MNIKLAEGAIKDKKELSEQEWREVKQMLTEVTSKLSHKNLKLISNPLLNHSIWQLTINEDETNHRAYLDIKNGITVVLAIWNFNFTHQGDQHWKELEERI